MKGLILDTSLTPALIASAERETITSFCCLEGGKKLTQTLFLELQKLGSLKNFDYIAVGIGPGSYIGLRTGATIAQTLAFALNLPLITFPSPLAFLPKTLHGPFAFVGDAKLDQRYILEGTAAQGQILEMAPPVLMPAEGLPERIKNKLFTIGKGFSPPEPCLERVAAYVHAKALEKVYETGPVKLYY